VRHNWFLLAGFLGLRALAAQTVVSFDDRLPGPGGVLHNASVSIEAVTFINHYTPEWDSWAGFAFSSVSNTVDGTWMNQYAAAQGFPRAYAVAYESGRDPPPEIRFDIPAALKSVRINNTTYAARTLRDGDGFGFARPFSDGDSFVLTLSAYHADGSLLAATNHYLADYRDGRSFIQTNWATLDLSWMPPEVVELIGTLETTDMGAWGPNTPTYFALADLTYAYGGLDSGISATHPAILCWADGVADYVPGPNVGAYMNPELALGPAWEGDGFNGSTQVVSLGDGGQITLTFPAPITDGPGADFVLFENAHSTAFLELAYVEVSSDGETFFRFPSHTLSAESVAPYPFKPMQPEAYGGLAGKHVQGLGTPFDLRLLAGTPGLDVGRVTHVRLVDVTGDGSCLDSYGNPIYDPYPTSEGGGFDLDGIGVLNPRIRIEAGPDGGGVELTGFETLLEYKAALHDPEWAPVNDRSAPGFYRYRLVRD